MVTVQGTSDTSIATSRSGSIWTIRCWSLASSRARAPPPMTMPTRRIQISTLTRTPMKVKTRRTVYRRRPTRSFSIGGWTTRSWLAISIRGSERVAGMDLGRREDQSIHRDDITPGNPHRAVRHRRTGGPVAGARSIGHRRADAVCAFWLMAAYKEPTPTDIRFSPTATSELFAR